jgi:hypothetical protein
VNAAPAREQMAQLASLVEAEQILTQYLPALGASLHREKQAVAETESAREFFDSREHRRLRLALSTDYQAVGIGVARGEEARCYAALFVQEASR